MKEYSKKDALDQTVDEIISELPLKERASLAKMSKDDVKVLQYVFDLYVKEKIDADDEEYEDIMHELWKRIRETHLLKIVK